MRRIFLCCMTLAAVALFALSGCGNDDDRYQTPFEMSTRNTNLWLTN